MCVCKGEASYSKDCTRVLCTYAEEGDEYDVMFGIAWRLLLSTLEAHVSPFHTSSTNHGNSNQIIINGLSSP
jgi:hypothetical protein